MAPIILPPSNDQNALVDGIQRAVAENVPLFLQPGRHVTRPAVNQHIQVGANGLRIAGPSTLPIASGAQEVSNLASIRRPDHSISLSAPGFNYGLFFVPADPTPDDIAQATWKPFTDSTGKQFEFAVVMRGSIQISGVQIDCNMQNQGLESLEPHAAAHSTMLGFSGSSHTVDHVGVPRLMYVGFDSVSVSDVGFINGGFADDMSVSFAGGAFHPHINQVSITNVASGPRLNSHRATLSFSGLAQHISIQDANIHSLDAEQDHSWRDFPRRDDVFTKSIWSLQRISADTMNFAMFGKVMTIEASDLAARFMFDISHAGGTIANSVLNIAAGKDSRFFLLDGMHFDGVHWRLPVDSSGAVGGITLSCGRLNDTCEATFTNCVFTVLSKLFSLGQLFNSAYSSANPGNRVTLTFSKCVFDRFFGSSAFPNTAVARVNERGTWTFDRADLGGRPLNLALPKSPHPDVTLIVH